MAWRHSVMEGFMPIPTATYKAFGPPIALALGLLIWSIIAWAILA